MSNESVSQFGKAVKKLLGARDPEVEPAEPETDDSKLPFALRTQMMTDDKSLLYRALVAAMGADAVIFAKVRLSDFLYVVGGGDDLKHAIKMDRKYVDFLLCDPFSMKPVAVVEMTYPLGPDERRPIRDPFLIRALKQAGISLLKIQACSSYPVSELRDLIIPKIQEQLNAAKAGCSDPAHVKQFETTISELTDHITTVDEQLDAK